jgi:hypothetical protein
MGAEIELEIEYEAPDIETVWKFVTFHDQPALIPTEQERSQWEIAVSGGKLCRKPKWRWYGRLLIAISAHQTEVMAEW